MICSKFSIPIGSFLFSLHILFLPPDNYIITNVCRKSYTSVCTIRVNCLLLFSITPYKPSLTVLAGKYLKPVKDTAHSGKTLPLNTRLSPRFETYLSFLQTVRLPNFPSFSIKSVRSHTGHSDILIFSSISFSTASLRLSSAHTPLLLTHSRSSAYARFRMPPS